MHRIAAAAFGAALTVGAAAATPAPRCLPRSAEIMLGPEQQSADPDTVRYRGLSGRPQHGSLAVSLCPDIVYRIAAKDERCVIRIPRTGNAAQIRAAIVGQMRQRPSCPVPAIIVAERLESPGGDARPATTIIPGNTIDVRRRREILVVVERDTASDSPCRVGAMPQPAGMRVHAAWKAYSDRLSQFGCRGFGARVWTGDRLASADDPKVADLVLVRAWPDPGTPFNAATVQPVWFAAPGPSPPPFALPDLRDKTLAEARRIAADAGLSPPAAVADNQLVDDEAAGDRMVMAQRPAPGNALAAGDRLLLVLKAQEAEPPPPVPGALVASGAIGGIAAAAMARRIVRRRVTPEAAKPARAVPVVLDSDRGRIRGRADVAPLRRTEGDAPLTPLAALLPLTGIGTEQLLAALGDTHPELIEWSRSNRAGALPPRRLAQLIIAALPAAFDVNIEDLLLNAAAPDAADRVSLVNRPRIDVLNSDGSLREAIDFIVDVALVPAALCLGPDRSPWAIDIFVAIPGRGLNPSRTFIADVRRIVGLAG